LWRIAKDSTYIVKDPDVYVYEMVEDLVKVLTNPMGFRGSDVSFATCYAYQMAAIVRETKDEARIWMKRYHELEKMQKAEKVRGERLRKEAEVQCQLGISMEVDLRKNTEDQEEGQISNLRVKEMEKRMEEILLKIVKKTSEEHELEEEEGKRPTKTYWDAPRPKEIIEKHVRRKERDKDKEMGQVTKPGLREDRREDRVERETAEEDTSKKKGRRSKEGRRRCAGVILELPGGRPADYASVVKRCEKEISLKELGIPSLDVKKTRGGALLMEIRDMEKGHEKAERLVGRIKNVIKDKAGAKVWHPSSRLRLRLTGLPLGATAVEVAMAVANFGGVGPGEIRVGPLRTSGVGRGTAWADCPADVARRVVQASGATGLVMGWVRVGVALVEREPPQCFRCLARGHLGRWCPSTVVRARCCLRCGEEGHRVGQCRNRPHCPICTEGGLRADHRPGDPLQCKMVPPGPLRRAAEGDLHPSPPDPGEGTSGEEKRRSDPSVQGNKSLDRGVTAHAPQPSTGEDRGELDRAEGGESRAGSPDPWADVLGASCAADEACRLGIEGSTSPSADMQVEWEEGPERGVKRKGPTTQPCSVVMAPLPTPKKGVGGGVKQRKKK